MACGAGSGVYMGGGSLSSGFDGSTQFWYYDLQSGTWTRKADIPAALSQGVLLESSGQLYLLSARGSGDNFWRYDPASDAWTVMPMLDDIADPYTFLGFSLEDKLYFLHAKSVRTSLREFDPVTMTWTTLTAPVTDGYFFGGGTFMGKGYILYNGTIEFFDPATNAWGTRKQSPFNNRRFMSTFELNDKIYAGGGRSNLYPEARHWWEYDPNYDQ